MADWLDRVRSEIVLISPDGNEFTALWIGNDRTTDKHLGIFEYPKFDGTVVQDLGTSGTRHPIALFFEGTDNDKEAQRFEKSFSESGTWEVTHPTIGKKILQPVSIAVKDSPIDSGNITEITTEWIEPIQPVKLRSIGQLFSSIQAESEQSNISASLSAATNAAQDLQSQVQSIRSAVNLFVSKALGPLTTLAESLADIEAQFSASKRTIEATISKEAIDMEELAGGIQNFVQVPLLALKDFETRYNAYKTIIEAFTALTVTETSIEDKNFLVVKELFYSASLVAVSSVLAGSEFTTRSQAIESAENSVLQFSNISDDLDQYQQLFDTSPIDLQYFSQSDTYSTAYSLTYLAAAHAITASYDLSVEKFFTIKNPIPAILFCIEKYGDLGIKDSTFDLFIDSNELKGNEILLLPMGRQVVVYA